MAIVGSVSFVCDHCGKKHSLGASELEFQVAAVTDDQQGEHIHYVFEYESNCDACGKRIDIEFEVWEGPVGTINHTDFTLSGAREVNENFKVDHPK